MCNFTTNSFANSSYLRANSEKCKQEIEYLACASQQQTELIENGNFNDGFYKLGLHGTCPLSNNELTNAQAASKLRLESTFFMGCSQKDDLNAYLNRSAAKPFDDIKIAFSTGNTNVKSVQMCVDTCMYLYKFVAYNELLNECICFRNVTNKFRESLISKHDCTQLQKLNESSQVYEIYHTGSFSIRTFFFAKKIICSDDFK